MWKISGALTDLVESFNEGILVQSNLLVPISTRDDLKRRLSLEAGRCFTVFYLVMVCTDNKWSRRVESICHCFFFFPL